MTQPPLPPMPPTPAFTGLDDLGDDDLAGLAGSQDSPFENPDYVVGGLDLEALEKASPDTDANEIEPGVPAQAEEPKKRPAKYEPPAMIDWSKATPRKPDEFAATPGGAPKGSPVQEQVRNFLNSARQNGWYGLFYPVVEYKNRNGAQSYVTKINSWRKGKTNVFGVRDGENIQAKCETQGKGKYILWVALMEDPGAKGEVDAEPEGPSATPAAG